MIDRNNELPVSRQAKLLGISRGSVYYQPRGVSEAEFSLMRHIDELHLEHPFMGSRQLTRQLRRQGFEAADCMYAHLCCAWAYPMRWLSMSPTLPQLNQRRQ